MTVPDVLQAYADRGLFRNFHANLKTGDFGFVWMGHTPMRLKWKAADRTILFKDLLPKVPAKGEMYGELEAFLRGRADADLPDHRRVDVHDYDILCENRRASVSIGLRITNGTEEEAMHKLMLVIHETFLLLHDRWLDYMHEEFGASLE